MRDKVTKSRAKLVKKDDLATSTSTGCISTTQPNDSSEDDWDWGSPGDDKAPVDNSIAQRIPHISKETPTPCLEKTKPLEKEEEDAVINVPPYMSQNRRNADIHAAAQGDGNKQCEAEQNVQATASAKILAPNPISPIHQLRVTNSIPQLMKALPPLPFEAQHDASEPCEVPSTDTKGLTNSPMALQPASGTSEQFTEPVLFGSSSRTPSLQQIQTQTPLNHSRFKVRVKSSQSSGLHSRWVSESPRNPGRSSSSPVKPKLKLKVSRNRMSSKLMGPNDPQVRNDGPRQYNSTSELRDMPPREVSPGGSSFEEQLTQHGADKRLSNIDEGTTRGHSTQVSDQFDIPYPPSAQEIVMAEPVSQSRLESKLYPFDRQGDSAGINRPKPLGYKTSNPQPTSATKAKGRNPRATPNTFEDHPTTSRSNFVSESSDESTLAASEITVVLSQRLRTKARRVRRWASEMKRTLLRLMRGNQKVKPIAGE
ncbi:hypothetical protein NW752_008773 [Fusarium irregulare]|uniref:Uncharacterized protein n=1 Tax=Fusarium irregulare TaxID=2494466 RepID=A0A9W8PL42_9HYPO|nr:hypothetical protein NW766_009000 [Fusarium irregulare]KAJ4010645.1 hypothetical protein NW752_008773 [Fusarium irregulare]